MAGVAPAAPEGAIKRVVILGGGLAGLAAASVLSEQGFRVQLFERKSIPGGRASSYAAQDTGEEVDNCQHVLMRCCTNLVDFYRRGGVLDRILWFNSVSFLEREGRISVLRGARLPAPFHLMPSFFRLRFLDRRDKLGIARILVRMLSPGSAREAEGQTALEWLKQQGQTDRALARFWRVILVSALNEELDRCSALYARQIFRLGFLAHPHAYEVGVPAVPLRELYGPFVDRLRERGGQVHFRAPVRHVELNGGGRVEGIRLDEESVPADYVVSAVPYDALPPLLPERWSSHAFFQVCRRFTASPISAVHLWFDRNVTDLDHAVLLDRKVQWMFNKTLNYARADDSGSYLGLVVSASREWMPLARREILATAEREVREAFPAAEGAQVVKAAVIKEANATFSATPGVDALRPPVETPIGGLYVAGDWVRTGWPATMEGAVRAGYLAAERILAAEGRPAALVQPDLPWESCLGAPE